MEIIQDREFQSLVGLLLSSLTKDQQTHQAVTALKSHGLTVQKMIETDEKKIDSMIKMVGFHATKAKNIKRVAQILKENHSSRPPVKYEDLLELPGIGPKMAHLYIQITTGQFWTTVYFHRSPILT